MPIGPVAPVRRSAGPKNSASWGKIRLKAVYDALVAARAALGE